MAKGAYIGVNGVARKVKKQYIGVSNVARKINKGYIGVSGVAKLFFASEIKASTSATSGVTYTNGLSGLSADLIHKYAAAISNNPRISTDISTVYIDDPINGVYRKLSVGDSINLAMSGTTYPFIIIAFSHDTLANSAFYGAATATGRAGISLQMRNSHTTTYRMNSSRTNSGGYDSTEMHTSTLPALLATMGSDVRSIIAPVKKQASEGNLSSTIETITCNLWLLSEIEVFGSCTYSQYDEGKRYMWYRDGNSTVKTVNGTNSYWSLRSPHKSNNGRFCLVDTSGDTSGYGNANTAYGVAPGLCF